MRVVAILFSSAYTTEPALSNAVERLTEAGLKGLRIDRIRYFGIASGEVEAADLESDAVRRIEAVPGVLSVRAIR